MTRPRVLPPQPGRILVPAQRAPDALDPVGGDGLTVARPAQHHAPLHYACSNGFGNGPDKTRIINGRFGVGAFVDNVVAEVGQKCFDGFLVAETGVVGANGNFHNRNE